MKQSFSIKIPDKQGLDNCILKVYKFKNEVGILKQEMMVLQHSSVRKSLHWHANM